MDIIFLVESGVNDDTYEPFFEVDSFHVLETSLLSKTDGNVYEDWKARKALLGDDNQWVTDMDNAIARDSHVFFAINLRTRFNTRLSMHKITIEADRFTRESLQEYMDALVHQDIKSLKTFLDESKI